MINLTGTTVASLHFEFLDGVETKTAVVHLTAYGTGAEFEDHTLAVGTILANAIQAETGYTLVTADMLTETTTRVFP